MTEHHAVPAQAAAPVPVAVASSSIISPETREELKKGHWGHFLKFIAIDLGVVAAVIGMNALYGRIKLAKEHQEHLDQARKHAHAGEFQKAYEALRPLPFNIGMRSQEILDEDLMAATEYGATDAEIRSLERFLASDSKGSKVFRNAITRQQDPVKRAKLVAVYSKLTDKDREFRMQAVGKMDSDEAEEFLYTTAEFAIGQLHDFNVFLAKWREQRRKGWFLKNARRFVR